MQKFADVANGNNVDAKSDVDGHTNSNDDNSNDAKANNDENASNNDHDGNDAIDDNANDDDDAASNIWPINIWSSDTNLFISLFPLRFRPSPANHLIKSNQICGWPGFEKNNHSVSSGNVLILF